eukprot:scaffold60399_cov57-Phaeocystis_antarctica.AAC.4
MPRGPRLQAALPTVAGDGRRGLARMAATAALAARCGGAAQGTHLLNLLTYLNYLLKVFEAPPPGLTKVVLATPNPHPHPRPHSNP